MHQAAFGVRNVSQTFQRFINHILEDLDFVYAYKGGMLIGSSNPQQNADYLKIVLGRLNQNGTDINVAKCHLGLPTVDFLGCEILKNGIRPTK